MIAAVVPAAGQSRRMGRPKLLLPVGGRTVIARVVSALREGGVNPVVVIVPPHDDPASEGVRREAVDSGGEAVVPESRPPDMRASFEWGLRHLANRSVPPSTVILAPADSPGLSPELVARVVQQAVAMPTVIAVPVVDGRRGHPIALPWSTAQDVFGLPADVGINALVAHRSDQVVEFAVDDPEAVRDLDTPDDYRRWANPDGSTG